LVVGAGLGVGSFFDAAGKVLVSSDPFEAFSSTFGFGSTFAGSASGFGGSDLVSVSDTSSFARRWLREGWR